MNPLPDVQDDPLRDQWSFPPGLSYLNHGSFGPSPRPVRQCRQQWLERMEQNPMRFYTRTLAPALERVQEALGRLLHCHGRDVALMENTTAGVNAVVRSVPLEPGDRVVTTDQTYGAVLRLLQRECRRRGAELVVVPVPLPLQEPEQITQAVLQAVDRRTRLVLVDHVSSAAALVFPVEEICRRLQDHPTRICIDAAHGLAMRPVDLSTLGCHYYVATCHKWLSAPFTCGLLWVHPRYQGEIQPAVLSWGHTFPGNIRGWVDEFHWRGTYDPSPALCIPEAIHFLEQVGWERFRRHGHHLACLARRQLCKLPGVEPLYPESWECFGTMVTVRIPPGDALTLQRRLGEHHRVEVIVPNWTAERFLRVSCHLYNTEEDIGRLVAALREELGATT